MITKFKKYWFFILLAFIATVLAIVWLLPKPEQAPKPVALLEQPNLPGVQISAQTSFALEPEIPIANIEAFSATKLPAFTETESLTIAEALGFKNEPSKAEDVDDGTVLVWVQEPKSLSITPKTREVRFHLDLVLSPLPEEGDFPEENLMKTDASDLLQSLGINPNTVTAKSRYIFLNGPDPVEGEREIANLYELSFVYKIQEKELLLPRGESAVARVWIDKRGSLVRLDMQNIIASYKTLGDFPLKDKTEIVQSLGIQGKLFSTGEHGDLPSGEIQHATIQSIDLVYFFDSIQNNLQPLFVLEGVGVKTNGETIKPSFYLPAISNSYYKN